MTTNSIEKLFNQARTHENEGDINQAIQICQKIIELKPENLHIYLCFLGSLYAKNYEFYVARKYLEASIKIDKKFGHAYYILGNVELSLGDPKSALECFMNAKCFDYSDESKLVIGITNSYERLGKKEKVIEITSQQLGLGNTNINILMNYALCCDSANREYATGLLEKAVSENELTNDEKRNTCFVLGKLLDKMGNYDKAFHYYNTGNSLKHTKFDQLNDNRSTKLLISTFNREFIKSTRSSRKKSRSIIPVFIVGFPRSGTSLLEQILDCHSRISGAGELPDIMDIASDISSAYSEHLPYPQCIQNLSQDIINGYTKSFLGTLEKHATKDVKYVIDKSPANYVNLGLIQILLPNARIIHNKRNPVDTCLSCYFQDFSSPQPHTYNLDDLATTYTNYQSIMNHWKKILKLNILDVNYEDIVNNTRTTINEILASLDLKWDEKCLHFYKNKRVTKTASYSQVTEKIYSNSIDRWKNYSNHIEKNKKLMELP